MCADWIPFVSQAKSAIQAMTGDLEGARITQENFSRQCPVVSQLRSAGEALAGDLEAAEKTQKEFGRNISGVADGIPVFGHIKGGIHYAVGDIDGGDSAMKAASHTTGAIAGGTAGFFVGGPVGAVAGGIAGGAAVDGLITGVDSAVHGEERLYGYVDQGKVLADNPTDAGEWFNAGVMVAGDGMAGYGAAKAAKAGKVAGQKRVAVKKMGKGQAKSAGTKAAKEAGKDLIKTSGLRLRDSDYEEPHEVELARGIARMGVLARK